MVNRDKDRLRILGNAMRAFASAPDEPGEKIQEIVRQTALAMHASCGCTMLTPEGTQLLPVALFDADPAALDTLRQLVSTPIDLAAFPSLAAAMRSGERVLLELTPEVRRERYVRDADYALATQLDLQHLLFVPLQVRGVTIGAFNLLRHGRDAAPFEEADIELAQNLADHAALAVANAKTFESMQSELEQRKRFEQRLSFLTELAQEFSAATADYQRLLDLFAQRMGEVIGDLCTVRFVSQARDRLEESGSLSHRDPTVVQSLREALLTGPVRLDTGFAAQVVSTGKALLVASLEPAEIAAPFDDARRAAVERLGIRSLMLAPLFAGGEVIGVASLARSDANRAFSDDDLKLFQDAARHASLAIANARLFHQLQHELGERQRMADRMRLRSELAQEFAAKAGDYHALLALVARRFGEIFGDGCSVLMVSEDGTVLETPGYSFHTDRDKFEALRTAVMAAPLRVGEGISGRVAATGNTAFVPHVDLAQVEATAGRRYRELIENAGISSIIAVPLRSGDKVVGVCVLYRTSSPEPYNEDDRQWIEDLAGHASLALTNSLLLEAGRRNLEDRLKTQEVLRRGFLEAAPDAVLIVDPSGKIILVNTQTETLFGYGRSELIGQAIETLVPMRFRAHHPENRSGYIHAPVTRPMGAGLNLFALRKDGSEFAAEISLSPIETPEGTLVAAAVRDVTERRREMEERNRRMQEANRLKSEFLANMSHELRTPLNAVIGFAGLMHSGKTGPLADIHKEYIGDILNSSRHLLQLINDVLDLAKVESGRMELRPEWAETAKLVSEVRDIIRGLAAEKSVRIGVELDPTVSKIWIDQRLFKQVLYNYLSNAIKFTPDGGRVTLRIRAEGDTAFRLEVEDTGIGIKSADMHRLFVEFQQLDQGTGKRYPGTGLGLALTKRIIEALGGKVAVTSVVGKGSTFSALIPREVPDGR